MWIAYHKEICLAFKSLYSGQFLLSTQLIKPNYHMILEQMCFSPSAGSSGKLLFTSADI